jgi:hypothetical protein
MQLAIADSGMLQIIEARQENIDMKHYEEHTQEGELCIPLPST